MCVVRNHVAHGVQTLHRFYSSLVTGTALIAYLSAVGAFSMWNLSHRYIIEKFTGTEEYGTVERKAVEFVERTNPLPYLPSRRP